MDTTDKAGWIKRAFITAPLRSRRVYIDLFRRLPRAALRSAPVLDDIIAS